MLGYVMMGTNDFEKSAKFYDELLKVVGAKRIMDEDSFIAWGRDFSHTSLSICKPHDGNAATIGNGVMFALQAESKEQVDALYNKAIELGGSDEGGPGLRGDTFYAGYFRDLDGNKLNAFYMDMGG